MKTVKMSIGFIVREKNGNIVGTEKFTTKSRYKRFLKDIEKKAKKGVYVYKWRAPNAKKIKCKYCGREVEYKKVCKVCEKNHRIKQIKQRRKHD